MPTQRGKHRLHGLDEEIEILKEQLKNNPLAMGTLVSEDFRMSAIAATISQETDENIILSEIDSVINAKPGSAEVYFGGLPYIRQAIMNNSQFLGWNHL